jgi:FKBP-type peptidyl-prolyl cis-trans isomerase
MKKQLQAAIAAVLVLGSLTLYAQTDTTPAKTTTKATKKSKTIAAKKVEETAEQKAIRELQEKLAAQQSQIDSLAQQNAAKDAALSTAQSAAATAQSQAAAAAAQAQAASDAAQAQSSSLNAVQSDVKDLKTANVGLATTISDTKKDINDKIDSPSALRYKGITITPGGFFAFEGVWRERSVNSDINTPFNSIPLPGANQGHVSELNFSGRQSRLSALFTGDADKVKLSGYAEVDFLGAGLTSNNNQSDSYVLRQRQMWAQAALKNGFTVTGGQMWSLVAQNKKGTDPLTEKMPQQIDAQYIVGFTWVRQPGIRFQQRWGDPKTGAFTAALSVEQAQITSFTATSATSNAVPANFFFAGAGTSGGLYNAYSGTYANNVAPDVVVKGAYDLPKAHFELGGIARFLRDYYYPITGVSSGGAYTYSPNYTSSTKAAGGVFGSISVSPNKYLDTAVQVMAGTGVGRYGTSQLADATVRPDGTLEPVRNYHGLYSLETHPTPKLDLFAYYGGEYAQRTVYTTTTGTLAGNLIGYGAPNLVDSNCYALPINPANSTGGSITPTTNCNSPTRYIQEGLLGFTYRLVNSPKLGRLQYAVNYELVNRSLWSGAQSVSYRAQDNIVLTSLRYYIP